MTKGQSITGQYYANLLRQLQEKIKKNQHGKLSLGVLFHQDNDSTQIHHGFRYIYDCSFQLLNICLTYPIWLPQIILFSKMKKEHSSQHFTMNNVIIDAVKLYLEDQDSNFYEEGICKLHDCWNKCVNLQGDYV